MICDGVDQKVHIDTPGRRARHGRWVTPRRPSSLWARGCIVPAAPDSAVPFRGSGGHARLTWADQASGPTRPSAASRPRAREAAMPTVLVVGPTRGRVFRRSAADGRTVVPQRPGRGCPSPLSSGPDGTGPGAPVPVPAAFAQRPARPPWRPVSSSPLSPVSAPSPCSPRPAASAVPAAPPRGSAACRRVRSWEFRSEDRRPGSRRGGAGTGELLVAGGPGLLLSTLPGRFPGPGRGPGPERGRARRFSALTGAAANPLRRRSASRASSSARRRPFMATSSPRPPTSRSTASTSSGRGIRRAPPPRSRLAVPGPLPQLRLCQPRGLPQQLHLAAEAPQELPVRVRTLHARTRVRSGLHRTRPLSTSVHGEGPAAPSPGCRAFARARAD
ncbi:hypothetical protein QF034_004932 [Streptomyces africanus]|uniref:Uncharacterized protein n=1 Tax=Streptomyces africanus TaxID=231024 RepID=A0ABU0QTJ7_9ACTN|nr:hypothetical protein [Streptomyces africanus]